MIKQNLRELLEEKVTLDIDRCLSISKELIKTADNLIDLVNWINLLQKKNILIDIDIGVRSLFLYYIKSNPV